MVSPGALLPLLAVLLGLERDVAPPRIGVPPTNESVNVIVPKGDGFLVGYTADGLPFTSSLDPEGEPADARMTPSPLGSAVSVAGDGNRYLAVLRANDSFAVRLFDHDGALIREVIGAPGYPGRRAVVWTGSDYVVSWVYEQVVHVLRVSRDGFASGSPIVAASGASGRPFAAVASGQVMVAILVEDEVRLFRVGTESITLLETLRPANPRLADFIGSEDAFLLLLTESVPGTARLNLYRVAPGHTTRISSSFPDEAWFAPGLLRLHDAVLLYGSSDFAVVGQRLTVSGEAAGERIALLDSRFNQPYVVASTNGRVVIFSWREALTQPWRGGDAVVAAVDVSLPDGIDGVPDGLLIAAGASARTAPDVARAASATLIVWTEVFEEREWIAGRLMTDAGDSIDLDIADLAGFTAAAVASDGVGFVVIWPGREGITSQSVDQAGVLGERHVIRAPGGNNIDAIWNGDSYVAVWEHARPRPHRVRHSDIYGHAFDRDGTPAAGEPRLLVDNPVSEPAVSSDGERLLLVWSSGILCPPNLCPDQTTINLNARVMSLAFDPLTPDFLLSNDPDVNEIAADVASSGTDWLVAWTAAGEDGQASIGQARVSREGFVTPGETIENARDVAVTWSGRYIMVWGEREPTHVPGLFVYSRRAPERFLGAAPQVFTRDVHVEPARRRAVVPR